MEKGFYHLKLKPVGEFGGVGGTGKRRGGEASSILEYLRKQGRKVGERAKSEILIAAADRGGR